MAEPAGDMTQAFDNALRASASALDIDGSAIKTKDAIAQQAKPSQTEDDQTTRQCLNPVQNVAGTRTLAGRERDIADEEIHDGAGQIAGARKILDLCDPVHNSSPIVTVRERTTGPMVQTPPSEG